MTKPLFLSLFAFAVACGTAEKEDTSSTEPSNEPASAPTSAPTSQPEGGEILYYITREWNGEWTIADDALTGTESYLENVAEAPGNYACNSVWDLTGTAGTSCTDCVWEMSVTAAFNEGASTLDGDCNTDSYEFTYAYTTDYEYNGESMGDALLYAETDGELGAFVIPNNPNAPQVDTYSSEITWDETAGTFSYKSGYKDYEYLYVY